jgi:hypothetical protein
MTLLNQGRRRGKEKEGKTNRNTVRILLPDTLGFLLALL